MVDVVSASDLDLVDITECLDVTARTLSREHAELLFDWLSVALQKWEQIS